MMNLLIAAGAGMAATMLLFPTRGVTGCPDGSQGGDCSSWEVSILVRYPGENGAVGMGIAVATGLATGLIVYFLLHRMFTRRDAVGGAPSSVGAPLS